MRILTTNYSRINDTIRRDYCVISISKGHPKFITTDGNIVELFPSWEIILGVKNQAITEKEYYNSYMNRLNNVGIRAIIEQIQRINTENKPVLLCCWCGTNAFCHRHIVAEYLNNHSDYAVRELNSYKIAKKRSTSITEVFR